MCSKAAANGDPLANDERRTSPLRNLVAWAGVCYSYVADMSADLADPDAALMLRVKQGDTAAFAELVDKYKQPVMNVAYRMLRDATEAEDLAQVVFVQVFKSADRYRVSSKFSTWLFTIARNLCLNEIRRRARHQAESMDAPHPEQEDQPLRQFEDKQTASPPERLLHGELEAKIEQAAGRVAREPAPGHHALPPGGAELRGDRTSTGLLGFGHQVTDSPRAGDAQAEAEALFAERGLARARMNATIRTRRLLIRKAM